MPLADRYHTEVITTSRKAKITGATHIEFDEHRTLEIAREIIKLACDRFPERGEVSIPELKHDLVPGFSHEYIGFALGGAYRGSFRPLNDAIVSGRIRGVVANIGCNNPRVKHDYFHEYMVKEFLKNDVLVVETGCGAIAGAMKGYLLGEAALEFAGPGLREVCEVVGAALSPAAGLAFLILQMLFTPCAATVAAIKQETGGWKWPGYSVGFLFVISFVVAICVYQLALLAGV